MFKGQQIRTTFTSAKDVQRSDVHLLPPVEPNTTVNPPSSGSKRRRTDVSERDEERHNVSQFNIEVAGFFGSRLAIAIAFPSLVEQGRPDTMTPDGCHQLGYLRATAAAQLAPLIDGGQIHGLKGKIKKVSFEKQQCIVEISIEWTAELSSEFNIQQHSYQEKEY